MKPIYRRALLLFFMALLGPQELRAALPSTLNYQGRVRLNAGGAAVPDSTGNTMVFKIYTVASGGSDIWNETWDSGTTNVATKDGLFNVVLGTYSTMSGLAFDQQYWLGVAVNGDAEMTPRQPLTLAPYTFRAKYAESADALTLRTRAVSPASPNTGDVLTWSTLNNRWEPTGSAGVPNPLVLSNGTVSAVVQITNTNTGSGNAIDGTSTDGAGIYGTSTNNTGVRGWVNNASVGVLGQNFGSGQGLYGFSSSGTGMHASGVTGAEAQGSTLGLSATASAANGVAGYFSSVSAVVAVGQDMGVDGEAMRLGGTGVLGRANLAGNRGVHGKASVAGAEGVRAEATVAGATALHSVGNAVFDGSSNTATFNTYVSFTAGTNLSSAVNAPLSLTLNSAANAPLSVSNATGLGVLVQGGSLGMSVTVYAAAGQAIYARSGGNVPTIKITNDNAVSGGIGLDVQTAAGSGINVNSTNNTGVQSYSNSSYGVQGQTGVSTLAGIYGFNTVATTGSGVLGESAAGRGVEGRATGAGTGVYANSATGVGLSATAGGPAGLAGYFNGVTGVVARGNSIGVDAEALSANGAAVLARANLANTYGLYGRASVAGAVGVRAESVVAAGTAFQSSGNAVFDGTSNTTTFNTFVSFTAGTNLSSAPAVPVSLTNSGSASTVSAFNSGGGSAIYASSTSSTVPAMDVVDGSFNANGTALRADSNQGTALRLSSNSGRGLFAFSNNYRAIESQGRFFGISATATDASAGVGGNFQAATGAIVAGQTLGLSVTAGSGIGTALYVRANTTADTLRADNDGAGPAIDGRNNSTGQGVYGLGLLGYGVQGESSGANFAGIYGQGSAFNNGIGVLAEALAGGNDGKALVAKSTYIGVSATSSGSKGQAFYGRANSTSPTAEFVNDGAGSPLKINALKFPANTGGSNQVLTTDGVSQMSWANAPSPAAPLSLTNSASMVDTIYAENTFGGMALHGKANIVGQGAILGENLNANGAGVSGVNTATGSVGGVGVFGQATGDNGQAINAKHNPPSGTGSGMAVYATSTASNGYGIVSESRNIGISATASAGLGYGGYFQGTNTGVSGYGNTGVYGQGNTFGVYAYSPGGYAVYAQALGAGTPAIYSYNPNGKAIVADSGPLGISATASANNGVAGYFQAVTGVVIVGHSLGLSVLADVAGSTAIAAYSNFGVAIYGRSLNSGSFTPSILGDAASGTSMGVRGRHLTGGGEGSLGGSLAGGGGTGVDGKAGNFGTGVLAEQGLGTLALNTIGDTRFDGSGNTTTFNTYVSFTAGTNLAFGVVAPVNLTSAAFASTVYAANTSSGAGVYAKANSYTAALVAVGPLMGISASANASGGSPVGIKGIANGGAVNGVGVWGDGDYIGVQGTGNGYGVLGQAFIGVNGKGSTYGVLAEGTGGGVGLSATAVGAAGLAGYFSSVTAVVSRGSALGLDVAGTGGLSDGIHASGYVAVRGDSTHIGGAGVIGTQSFVSNGSSGVTGQNSGNFNTGSGVTGQNFATGNSGAGVSGVNGSSLGAGVLANNTTAGAALRVSGSSVIDSGTNTIFMASYVSFRAGTNLSGGITPPVTWITGTAASDFPNGVLSVTNTGNGNAVVGYATLPGGFAGGGMPDFTSSLSAGLKGYTSVTNSAGVVGFSNITVATGAGVMGIGMVGVGGFARGDIPGSIGGQFGSAAINGMALFVPQGNSSFQGPVSVTTGTPFGTAPLYVNQGTSSGGGGAIYGFTPASATAAIIGESSFSLAPGPSGNASAGLMGKGAIGVVGLNKFPYSFGVIGSIDATGDTTSVGVFGINGGNGAGGSFQGLTGVVASGSNAAGSIGLLAQNNLGAGIYALKAYGNTSFGPAGSTHTFASGSTLDLTGVTVLGLSSSVTAPLSLTLSSSSASALYISQSASSAGISVTASNEGVFATTRGDGGGGKAALRGVAFSPFSGNMYGVIGESNAMNGGSAGVVGRFNNAAITGFWGGTAAGVAGLNDDPSGVGVYARAASTVGSSRAMVAEGGAIGISVTAALPGSGMAGLFQGTGAGISATAGFGIAVYGRNNGGGAFIPTILGDASGTGMAVRGRHTNGAEGSLGGNLSGGGAVGVDGKGGSGGIGVLAEQGTGSFAFNSVGDAKFDGSGNTTTFNTYVNFLGGTSLGGSAGNSVTGTTTAAWFAHNTASNYGIYAQGDNASAIYASAPNSPAIIGQGGPYGVQAIGNSSGLYASGANFAGVEAYGSNPGSAGVIAQGKAIGVSASAIDTTNGMALILQGANGAYIAASQTVAAATAVGISVVASNLGFSSQKAYGISVSAQVAGSNANQAIGILASATDGGNGLAYGGVFLGVDAGVSASASTGPGVFGTGSTVGVQGKGSKGMVAEGINFGLSATASNSAGNAIYAEANTTNSTILGINDSTSISTIAIYGSASGSGTGVKADVFDPGLNSKGILAELVGGAAKNAGLGVAAFVANTSTVGVAASGAALFVSGSVKTSNGNTAAAVVVSNTLHVPDASGGVVTFGPAGSFTFGGQSGITIIRIYSKMLTAQSVVITNFYNFSLGGGVSYYTKVFPGTPPYIELTLSSVTTLTAGGTLNWLIIN